MTQESPLVELRTIDPTIVIDIRYATKNNIFSRAFYSQARCFLRKNVALALQKVQNEAKKLGLSLKVWDGYRPLPVQQEMWNLIQDERYVSNPAKNKGRHTRGTAVDVTLVDKMGRELEMPTPFDDLTEKAFSDAKNISHIARQNRNLLKTLMEKQSFVQFPTEWWHFDFIGWQNDTLYPPCDIRFEEL